MDICLYVNIIVQLIHNRNQHYILNQLYSNKRCNWFFFLQKHPSEKKWTIFAFDRNEVSWKWTIFSFEGKEVANGGLEWINFQKSELHRLLETSSARGSTSREHLWSHPPTYAHTHTRRTSRVTHSPALIFITITQTPPHLRSLITGSLPEMRNLKLGRAEQN